MLDAAHSNRPERRSALIAHELSRLNINIVTLSEVRFPGEGSLQEHGTGYTLFWSGKPTTEESLSGVGLMISTSIASRLVNLPTGYSDHIMFMRLPLKNKRYPMLFSVSTPTLRAEPTEKNKFYSDLRSCLQSTPADDKVIILGDFNAIVGQDTDSWKGVLGRHGVGNYNDNGRLLLELCTEEQFVITNTIFYQKDGLKTTWIHPQSKHWILIDYVLVYKHDLKDIIHTKVMPSAECHTDHRLVHCKLRLHFKPEQPKKKFNLNKLQLADVRDDFQAGLPSKFENSDCQEDTSPESLWEQLKSAILQTSEEVPRFTTKKNKDWFDENNQEIQELLAKKRSPSPPGSAVMSCEEGCLPSHFQHPPA